jgi:hypothetical protein
MAIDQVDRTTVTTEPAASGQPTVRTDVHERFAGNPPRPEMARRIIVLVFGLIQLVIGARIVLLLLDAREANGLVAAVLAVSQWFVGPFEGILRTDSLNAAGSVLDITAIVAFVGWTILEVIILWAVRLFRRDPA